MEETALQENPAVDLDVGVGLITPDPSTTIPNEIWVKILSQLAQKELVRKVRLVCSSWKNVVDEHFSFSVIVHDDKTDLKRILQLRIKDCLITKLYQDVDILKFPEILKRVRFWGTVRPTSMHRILSKASNLEELSLTRYPLTQRNLLSHGQDLNLKKLLKLEILGYCCKDASEEVSNNVIRLISQNMASLSRVFLNVACYWKYMDSIIIAFFDFLARHKNHLRHVNASLIPAANGYELISLLPTNLSQSIKDALYNHEDEGLQLESLRLSIASKYIPCWSPIIQKQRKLVDLRIHWISSSEPTQSHLTGISSMLLYPAIIQSASILVHLDLRELNLAMDETSNPIPFDASILSSAQNLRRLVLVRNKDDCQRNIEPYGSPTIININNHLPALIDLEIVRFKCLTSELLELIEGSENFKSVKLQHIGSSIGQGVHGGMVELLTTKPKIKTINISPLNYHEAEQNMKLDLLKSKFQGISRGDHLYFDFDRFRAGIPQPQSRYQASTSSSSTTTSEILEHHATTGSENSIRDYMKSRTARAFGFRSSRSTDIWLQHSNPGCSSSSSSSSSRSQQYDQGGFLRRSMMDYTRFHRAGASNNIKKRLGQRRSMSLDRFHEFQYSMQKASNNIIPRPCSSSCSKSRHRSWSVNDL